MPKSKFIKYINSRSYQNIRNQRNGRAPSNNNAEQNRIQNITLFSSPALHVGMRRSNANTNINIEIENNQNRENNINPIINTNIRGKNFIIIFIYFRTTNVGKNRGRNEKNRRQIPKGNTKD